MRQVIDWEKIEDIAGADPDYIFYWKYDGTYSKGDIMTLSKLSDNKLAEVIGFMKDREKTEEENRGIAEEEARQAKVLFEAYSKIDFCTLTTLINEHWTEGFDDECIDVKCSDYIDITKHEYDMIDLQKIVKAFCDEALKRYMSDYVSWLTSERDDEKAEEPSGQFCHNGICIDITKWGVSITYSPISIYAAAEDEVIGVVE